MDLVKRNYRVAIYMRLSREDGNDESQSIQGQRDILRAYVEKQGWTIAGEYADDGYSGTNFERPEFKRLIEDIELGRIDLVITKDLSRLGRNYIQVGYYTEEYFPEKNVRYIALNDNYDSDDGDGDDFIPFRNVINEWYAKDISKKIRFTLDNKSRSGEPRNTVFPIFGYAYNEIYERIPDSETAPIVQLIYKKFVELASTNGVAKYLKSQGIRTPQYYNAVKHNYNKKKVLAMPEEQWINWTGSKVKDILKREEYLGVYKTAQTKSISFKNKKRIDNKNCYVFESRYAALIDRETWEIAQKLLRSTNGTSVPIIDNKFLGLVYCADCGSIMRFERKTYKDKESTDYRYYCKKKTCSFTNSITRKSLETALKLELLKLKEVILSNESEFIQFAAMFDRNGRIVKTDIERDLGKAIEKDNEIDLFIEQLFEQNVKGIIPVSTFNMMMARYKKEKEALERQIGILTRRRNEEIANPKNELRAQDIVAYLKEVDEESLLETNIIQKIVKKIIVRTRFINNSVNNRTIELTIQYFNCDEIIKGFITNEE